MGEKDKKYVLGLDISTTCIGISLFEDIGDKGALVMLDHFSPKIKDKNMCSTEKLMVKSDMFYDEHIKKLANFNITRVIIEEPLTRSNNANTVIILVGFNMLVSKMIRDTFGVIPEFISSYDGRKYSFPELMGKKDVDSKGKKLTEAAYLKKDLTLFGGHPKDVDKKMVIWELVADKEIQVVWLYNKKGELLKVNCDMSDSYVVVLGQMRKLGVWK